MQQQIQFWSLYHSDEVACVFLGCGCWEDDLAGYILVQYLRELIADRIGIPSNAFRLCSGTKQLVDDKFLSDYIEIGDNCTVNVLFSCVGGGRRKKLRSNHEIESKFAEDDVIVSIALYLPNFFRLEERESRLLQTST